MQRKSSMKKNLKTKLAGIMAGLMAFSSLGGLIAVPTLAATSDDGVWEYEIYQTVGETNYISLTGYNGNEENVVIPDYIGDDETNNIIVMIDSDNIFEGHDEITSLTFGKYITGFSSMQIFDDLKNVNEYSVVNENTRLKSDNGVLYRDTELIAYPKSKYGSYTIVDGTTEIGSRAFYETNIETLYIPNGLKIDNEFKTDINKFEYDFLGSNIDSFEGANCIEGSLFSEDKSRLIAYGNDSNTNLSNITSANPYAFSTINKLDEIRNTIPSDILISTPFSFYSGEIGGDNYVTRYFNIDGKTAYCYEYGVYNPETVGNMEDYNDDITSNPEITKNVKKVLFLGYGNDAMNLIESTGITDEAAKNVTGSLVWEYASHVTDNNDFVFDASEIYGDDNVSVIQAYYDAIKTNMANVTDEIMADFELGFYNNGEAQNLIVINKVSRPEIPEKPSITISKQDITTKEELPGAQLTVTMEDTVIDSWVSTDTPHVITELEDGVYTLTEVTAPDGYEKAESIEFTVKDGKVSVDTIVMYDAPEDTYVYISKQDATTKKELPGATLQLIKDNVVVDEWVSTDTPHVIGNPADGTYTLVEITAPNGYKVAESITFEVVDGKTSPNPIVMYDEANVATPSEPDKPTTEEPEKPIDGGYSGWEPDEPEETTPDDTDITIIPTEPTETTPEPTKPEETAPEPEGDRKPIKTGDIMGTLQILFGTMASCGAAGYVIYRKRRK